MSDIITNSDGQQVCWYPTETPPELYHKLDQTFYVRCPHCKGAGVIHLAAVTAGEPQPEETLDCELCGGLGDVLPQTAALYCDEGLDAVLKLRRSAVA